MACRLDLNYVFFSDITIMTTIIETKEIEVTKFVSSDGQIFQDKNACERHEENIEEKKIKTLYLKTIPTDGTSNCVTESLEESHYEYCWFHLCKFPNTNEETVQLFFDYWGITEGRFSHKYNAKHNEYDKPTEFVKFFKENKTDKPLTVLICFYCEDDRPNEYSIYNFKKLVDNTLQDLKDQIKEVEKIKEGL